MEHQRNKTSSDRLFRAIGDDIVDGRLKPGEKISEPEVARRFGTSRAPVREAIRRLEERGLVVRKPHLGPRVASFSIEKFIEIFEVREALEGIACRLASERMSDVELAQMRSVVERHAQELKRRRIDRYVDQDRDFDFHFHIARGSKNTDLIRLLCEDYYNLLRLYRNLHSGIPGRGGRALEEHFRILEALEARDSELAELLMRRHIASARMAIKHSFETSSSGDVRETE